MARTSFEQTLGTDLSAIAPFAEAFALWAQSISMTPQHVFQINVVLEELITNAVVHGLGEGLPGWIRVRVRRTGDELQIELRDSAPAFDPFGVPAPSLTVGIAERKIGGLGVHFVRTMMDEWQYVREAGQNVIYLRKSLVTKAP